MNNDEVSEAGYLWALCAFSIQPNTFAQSIPPLTYLGIEQGLFNNAVTSIYQDYNGFMWFGTYDGLNRYDGYNFTIYRNEFNDTNSVADNRVNECRRRILLLLQRPAGLEAGRSSPATRYRRQHRRQRVNRMFGGKSNGQSGAQRFSAVPLKNDCTFI